MPPCLLSQGTQHFDQNICLCVCFWCNSPHYARASSFKRFLDHTQRRITVGKTPLDKWSARRRDLYLTTHNTQSRQTSMPPLGFEPTNTAGERPQTYALDRAATGTGKENIYWLNIGSQNQKWSIPEIIVSKLIRQRYVACPVGGRTLLFKSNLLGKNMMNSSDANLVNQPYWCHNKRCG